MEIKIRKANESDVEGLNKLLYQVHDVHANARPDIFKKGMKKFNETQLLEAINNDENLIYVAVNEREEILGHLFCEIKVTKTENIASLCDRKELFIDDLCVDEKARGQKIGQKLFDYSKEVAKNNNCDSITLHIWNFNEAALRFYERIGFNPLKTLMEHKL